MDSCSLHSSTIATASTLFTRSGKNLERNSVFRQASRLPCLSSFSLGRKLQIVDAKAQASVTPKASSQSVGTTVGEAKDENLAFVAGATGKVGSRAVRELLKLGFRVRAGVRSAQRTGSLVESVKRMKPEVEGSKPVERLEIIECDLEKLNQIRPALGNASVVLCCIGASEKEVFDITGPYRIDYMATKNLVDASRVAKVKHFIMVSSLGTNKIGFPAAILNLFWGVLVWKRKAEEALIASGVPYTIVRPGGMERPTDAYKETHNLLLSEEDLLFGGQVSNLQIAELIAFMAKNRRISYCKVVEAIAETTAPLTPMDKLLEKIPSQRVLPKELDTEDQPQTAASPEPPASPEPEPEPPVNVVPEASSSLIVEEPAEAKLIEPTPLSPYTAYEDLKPPSSPSPTPSGPKAVVVAASPPPAAETASPEVVPETAEIPPEVAASPEVVSETAEIQPEVAASLEVVPETAEIQPAAQISRPLSPYAAYEDLKPPSSPSPTASGPKEVAPIPPPEPEPEPEASSPTIGSNESAKETATDSEDNAASQASKNGNSPFQGYEDLKPPTSPSPTAPNGAPIPSATSADGEPLVESNPPPSPSKTEEPQHTEPKPRPLSPYAMYEDMKPPSTPSPSPKK